MLVKAGTLAVIESRPILMIDSWRTLLGLAPAIGKACSRLWGILQTRLLFQSYALLSVVVIWAFLALVF